MSDHAFDVLGDPVRRRILEVLCLGEASSGDIVKAVQEEFAITQAAVSQHLKVLREADFAKVRPDGARRIYSLDKAAFVQINLWLLPFQSYLDPVSGAPTGIAQVMPPSGAELPDPIVMSRIDGLNSPSTPSQAEAIRSLIILARSGTASWAYVAWDLLMRIATDKANDNRGLAACLLCELSKNDPEQRITRDIDRLFAVAKDERLNVARIVLQDFWRIGLVSVELRIAVVSRLVDWFSGCTSGTNSIQVRFAIIDSLAKLHRATGDPAVSLATSELVGK